MVVGRWGEKVVRKVLSGNATGLGRSTAGEGVAGGRARLTGPGKINPLRG